MKPIRDLQSFVELLRREKQLVEINVPVDPKLEAAEIHRRVIAARGPALLFKNIKGSPYPLVTNLFGTRTRIDLAFGSRPEEVMRAAAALPENLFPLSTGTLWRNRRVLHEFLRLGTRRVFSGPVVNVRQTDPHLSRLPLLTSWQQDGGPFFTLPLVYTQHPETGVHNLGIYRLQRFDDKSTGFHCQIGKGAGFHLARAAELGRPLPVNVFLGGPPAAMLAAVAPLPENVPELLLAALLLGDKIRMVRNPLGPLPLLADAECAMVGSVTPGDMHPEGPFGDHYGYYSLCHSYPVFRCHGVLRRKNPLIAATVVGKPRQEDFFLGDYLQELLSPLFPKVMPSVEALWSYGETGYHALASAVVKQRHKREAMTAAFRILGEGQLSLTKFLLVLDRKLDLRSFKLVLEHVLARADFRTDLFVLSHVPLDTLDYTGPEINLGSKGLLLGVGDPLRTLPAEYHGASTALTRNIRVFCRGCLVVDGVSHQSDPLLGEKLLEQPAFQEWPLIVLVDDAVKAARDTTSFLWTTFTRFNPSADLKARAKSIAENHIQYTPPILIDARMKAGYPAELECDPETAKLVEKRWREYFS